MSPVMKQSEPSVVFCGPEALLHQIRKCVNGTWRLQHTTPVRCTTEASVKKLVQPHSRVNVLFVHGLLDQKTSSTDNLSRDTQKLRT